MMDEEEAKWLTQRQKGIGGSDISVILGLNPYKTPYKLWLEKTGQVPLPEENKFMRAGKLLEPVIVTMWEEATGLKTQPESADNKIHHHKDYPFILGTPDRIYVCPRHSGILECKNTRHRITVDNLPKYWFCQVQWYLGITGLKEAQIAWLIQGYDFHYAEFEFSPSLWEMMIEKAIAFWKKVEQNMPPELLRGSDASYFYPSHTEGKIMKGTPSTIQLCKEINDIRFQTKKLKNKEEEIIESLKIIMRDSESLIDELGHELISWRSKNDKRRFFIRGVTNDKR